MNLWWNPEEVDEFEIYRKVLECFPKPEPYIEFYGEDASKEISLPKFLQLNIYRQTRVEIFKERFETDDLDLVWEKINEHKQKNYQFQVYSAFNFYDYHDEKHEVFKTINPLDVQLNGLEYGFRENEHFRRYGLIEIAFYKVGYFQINNRLIEKSKHSADSHKYARMVEKLRQNYEYAVLKFAREIIKHTNPEHLIVCTEGEIHPLTAHSIYHRNWEDFVSDWLKIAELHSDGGVYFTEINPNALPPYIESRRKSEADYGHLREWSKDKNENEFSKNLQPKIDYILANQDKIKLTRNELEDCLVELEKTEFREIENSFLLTAHGAPFKYLEEPYFKIFEKITE